MSPWRRFLLEMMPRGSICAEIGVWRGDFAAEILSVVGPLRLHLIDPWRYQQSAAYQEAMYGDKVARGQPFMDQLYQSVCARFGAEIDAGTVQIHRADSAEASAAFADEYFDWIYVDGNHYYEYVKADLETYHSKVQLGGFLAGDDYVLGGWWKDGVQRAVDEELATGRWEKVVIHNGQYVLRRIQ